MMTDVVIMIYLTNKDGVDKVMILLGIFITIHQKFYEVLEEYDSDGCENYCW